MKKSIPKQLEYINLVANYMIGFNLANKDIYFGFMASDDYAFDAKQVFVGYNGEHKSCHLIFVTENGRADEPVLAIITPRDVYDC